MLKTILNVLLYFIICVPCWSYLFKDYSNFKEKFLIFLVVIILYLADKFLLK